MDTGGVATQLEGNSVKTVWAAAPRFGRSEKFPYLWAVEM